MAMRNLLHHNKLKAFEKWLIEDGWEISPTKGLFEVLRANKIGKRRPPLIVYTTLDGKEHYSVADRDVPVVRNFLRETRISKHGNNSIE